jgi:hypothetical protein
MSLNFYGRIKQYVDSDKNIVIQVVTDDLTDKQAMELKHLKAADVINLVAVSADMSYTEPVDVETQASRYEYAPDPNTGVWTCKEVEQTALDLDGQPNYENATKHITANIVDNFMHSQKIEYPDFNVKQALNMIAEGYDYDDIAKELKITAVALLDDLNKARQYFAPYAATWYAQQQEKEEN